MENEKNRNNEKELMSVLAYLDTEIIGIVTGGLRTELLYKHPDMVSQLDEEAFKLIEGLNVSELKHIMARKLTVRNVSLVELITDYKRFQNLLEHKEGNDEPLEAECPKCKKTIDLNKLSKNECTSVSHDGKEIYMTCPHCGEFGKIEIKREINEDNNNT